jgi:uncharacterized integral membrane protein
LEDDTLMSLLHRHHLEPLAQPGVGHAHAARRGATQSVPRTRVGSARVTVCAAAVIVIALIVLLLAQNTRSAQISFLWTYATTSFAVALMIAAVGGILLTVRRFVRRRHH